MSFKIIALAAFILSAAFFLRLYRLDHIEVSSLFGRELEIAFSNNSFLFSITNFSFNLFGVNVFALKLPGAIFGALTVGLAFFMGAPMSGILKIQNRSKLGLFSMLILATSPWHIQISRSDLGLSLGLFCIMLAGLLIFLINKKKSFIFLWVLPAALAFYSDKIFLLPALLMVAFVSIYHSNILIKNKSLTVLSVFLLALFVLPFADKTKPLFKVDDLLTYQKLENIKLSKQRVLYSFETPLSKILYFPQIENAKLVLSEAFYYFQPHALFFSWDKDQYMSSNFGIFYPVEIVLFILGCIVLYKKSKHAFAIHLVFILFIVLYTAVFQGGSKSIWLLPVLPVTVLLSSLGLLYLTNVSKYKKVYVGIFIFFFTFFTFRFFSLYYISEKKESFFEKYEEAFSYVKDNLSGEKIVVLDPTYGKNLNLYAKLFPYVPKNVVFIYKEPDSCRDSGIFVMPASKIPEGAKVYFFGKALDSKFSIGVTRL